MKRTRRKVRETDQRKNRGTERESRTRPGSRGINLVVRRERYVLVVSFQVSKVVQSVVYLPNNLCLTSWGRDFED